MGSYAIFSILWQEFPNLSWYQCMTTIFHHFYFHLDTSQEKGKQNLRFSPNIPTLVTYNIFFSVVFPFFFFRKKEEIRKTYLVEVNKIYSVKRWKHKEWGYKFTKKGNNISTVGNITLEETGATSSVKWRYWRLDLLYMY